MDTLTLGRTCGLMYTTFSEEIREFCQALLGATVTAVEELPTRERQKIADTSKVMYEANRMLQNLQMLEGRKGETEKGIKITTNRGELSFGIFHSYEGDLKALPGLEILGMEVIRNWEYDDIGSDLLFYFHFSSGHVLQAEAWDKFDPSNRSYKGKELHPEFWGKTIIVESDPLEDAFRTEYTTAVAMELATQQASSPAITVMTPTALLNELNFNHLYPKVIGNTSMIMAKADDQEYEVTSRYRLMGNVYTGPHKIDKVISGLLVGIIEIPGTTIMYDPVNHKWKKL